MFENFLGVWRRIDEKPELMGDQEIRNHVNLCFKYRELRQQYDDDRLDYFAKKKADRVSYISNISN